MKNLHLAWIDSTSVIKSQNSKDSNLLSNISNNRSLTFFVRHFVALLFAVSGCLLQITAQSIAFCGVLPEHQATGLNPDSILFDRFGNSYDLGDLQSFEDPESPNIECESSGYFKLQFEDVDPLYLEVICRVFSDLSNVIEQRTNIPGCGDERVGGKIKLKIRKNNSLAYPILAAASPLFWTSSIPNCDELNPTYANYVINGSLQDLSFVNPVGAMIDIKFSVDWHTDLEDETPEAGYYDLYSVVLHEALHIIGFHSLIGLDGTGALGYFSQYDQLIRTTTNYDPDGSTAPLIPLITGNCSENCWELNSAVFSSGNDLGEALSKVCSNEGSIDFIIGESIELPIAGSFDGEEYDDPPSTLEDIVNMLSHLHPSCNEGSADFVMQPSIDDGMSRRNITETELMLLCDMGYKTNVCDGCYITAFPNHIVSNQYLDLVTCCPYIFTVCPGEEIIIEFSDLICNDFSNDGIEIVNINYRDNNTIDPIFTVGTDDISITGPNVNGVDYLFDYTIKTCECKMLTSYFRVAAIPCLECPDECDNLVCVHDFEEWDFDNWPLAQLDLFDGHYWAYSSDWGVNLITHSTENSGNEIIEISGVNNPSVNGTKSGLSLELKEPITAGCDLKLSMMFSGANKNSALEVYVSEFPPCEITDVMNNWDCEITHCDGYDYAPICALVIPVESIASEVSFPDDANFTFVEKTIPNIYGIDINYIILSPYVSKTFPAGKGYSVFIDDLVVKNDCINGGFDFLAVDDCEVVVFTANDQESSYTYDWDFGDQTNSSLMNPSHDFVVPGIFTVSLTVTDECGNSKTTIRDVNTGECCEDRTISSNTTWWSGNLPPNSGVFHTLTVQHGNSLFIDDDITLQFCQGGALIIEDGAFVQCLGKLTTVGDGTWRGVFVNGITSASQQADCSSGGFNCIPQGFISLGDGAIIENAEIGIRNYGPQQFWSTGGMIRAENTQFINNVIAVDFGPYYNYDLITNQPRPSLGYFRNCEFTTSSDYNLNTPFKKFIHIDDMDGVTILGCTFTNELEFPSSFNYFTYGTGVEVSNSRFLIAGIHGIDGSTPSPFPCSYPCVVTDSTKFYGLGEGVSIYPNEGTSKPYSIIQSSFRNCYRGIRSFNVSGGTILYNRFFLGNVPNPDIEGDQIGIELSAFHNGFELQENKFIYSTEGVTNAIGISASNLGAINNIIRKNEFTRLLIGNEAFEKNAHNNLLFRGLTYFCNKNNDTNENGYDFFIPNTEKYDNISAIQGYFDPKLALDVASGNILADATDIANFGEDPINYYYFGSGSNQTPFPLIGQGYESKNVSENECETFYCSPPCIDLQNIDDLKSSFYEILEAFKLSEDSIELSILNEDSLLLIKHIAQANFYLMNKDKAAYNVLVHLWFDTVNFELDTVINWCKNIDSYGADVMIAGILATNGRLNDALDQLDLISLTRDLSNEELEDIEAIKTIYSILDTTNVFTLSQIQRNIIRSFVMNELGISSSIGRGILSKYDEHYSLPYYLNDDFIRYRSTAEIGDKPSGSKLDLYPNPTNLTFTVDWKYFKENYGELFIYDLQGRLLLKKSINANYPEIINASNWPSGIYAVRIQSHNNELIIKRFVKN